ncbi:MAG TPA: NAD(P)H-dependent oxidoreductase subunit E, partial [Terriglobales bacterium]|nr:NAD(P)H-dependent oxidoreductase subunit E [Terriglobales bacterium]
MDLHLTAAKASAEEQAAIEAVLKKLESEPGGASGQMATNGHVASNGLPLHSKRHLLLPVLHAIQERIGWISPGALNYASLRLSVPPAEAHGVASFYEMFSLTPRPPVVAHVCDDIACMTRGAEALCAEVERKLGPAGKPSPDGKAIWQRSSCLGLCERAPAALITVAGKTSQERVLAPGTAQDVSSTITEAANGKLSGPVDTLNSKVSAPQAGQAQLRLLRRVGQGDAPSLDGYRRLGGYDALRKAFELGPERVIQEVIEAKLLGRGGA